MASSVAMLTRSRLQLSAQKHAQRPAMQAETRQIEVFDLRSALPCNSGNSGTFIRSKQIVKALLALPTWHTSNSYQVMQMT